MNAIVKQFNYQGQAISFNFNSDEVMANATEMAKSFGKLPNDWLRLPSTKTFLAALLDTGKYRNADSLVVTERGGITGGGGTWMHEDAALEFARWLNPAFAIWCNDRIKELIKHGATAINPESLLDPDFIINLANALKQEREEKVKLMQITEKQQEIIKAQAPKAEYCDRVLQSSGVMATTQIAADLSVSAIKLNRFLFEYLNWIFKVNGTWVPSAKIKARDYMKSKTFVYINTDGREMTEQHWYWTQRGRAAVMDEVRKYRDKNLYNSIL